MRTGSGSQYSVATSGPQKSAADYRLTVGGLVDRPATYTLDALKHMDQTRIVRDLQCVTGWRVPETSFEGVRLSVLLDAAWRSPERSWPWRAPGC